MKKTVKNAIKKMVKKQTDSAVKKIVRILVITCLLNIGVAILYKNSLLRGVVRTCEGDYFFSVGRDRVGGKDSINLVTGQDRLSGAGINLRQLIFGRISQNVLRQELVQTGIKAANLVVRLVELAEQERRSGPTDPEDSILFGPFTFFVG